MALIMNGSFALRSFLNPPMFPCMLFLTDPQYKLPQLAPDGNYCPSGVVINGDVNGDGVVNILDVVAAVNIVLSGEYQISVDLNGDGSVDILDVILIVLIIQGE